MIIPDILMLMPNRVWRTYSGGRYLDLLDGSSSPSDGHFPEDWIASTVKAKNIGRENIPDEGLSKVEIEGNSFFLKDLFRQFPLDLLGDSHYVKYGPNTQFLAKFLDAAIRLHIQAHPAVSFSQKYLNSNSGKTEVYIILKIREEVKNPYVYIGFQHPLSQEIFREAVQSQNIPRLLSCFDKIPVSPGDVFIVPGGLPHAIGEGIFMAEIMEPTDFAVRLEFDRGGCVLPEQSRFMGRGIDFALEMINFNTISPEDIKRNLFCSPEIFHTQEKSIEYNVIDRKKTPCFSIDKLEVNGLYRKKADSFYIGIVTKGGGHIESLSQKYELKTGEKFIVPYKTGEIKYCSEEGMQLYFVYPPE
jgi:mannose-6-phosphate isomerase